MTDMSPNYFACARNEIGALFGGAKRLVAARYGDERIRFYNPVRIVKFVSKKEICLNRNFSQESRAAVRQSARSCKKRRFCGK
jgi:hypothetical protein